MPDAKSAKVIMQRLGWVERFFILVVALYVMLLFAAPASGWLAALQVAGFILGIWIAVRLLRMAARKAIWRLRNRLLVTYLFIGAVPILLIATLVGLGIWSVTSQVAVYLVTSELDRHVDSLKLAADSIAKTEPANRADTIRHIDDLFYRERFPGLAVILRTAAGVTHYPEDSRLEPPPREWGAQAGVVVRGEHFYAWSHQLLKDGDVTVIAPLTSKYLATLVPNLGVAELIHLRPSRNASGLRYKVGDENVEFQKDPAQPAAGQLPPPAFRFDSPVFFASLTPVMRYDQPGASQNALLYVQSRLSAVYRVLFSRKTDLFQGILPTIFIGISIGFLVVELISLVVGLTITRTITSAVHHLYLGTQRVMQSDFSHRIEVKGRDQLSDLSQSFNVMTERIEDLLTVAKEKERLQAEIEIAREVQSQLYPKKVPDVQTLKLTAVCKPARMVSGDYFDYECVRDTHLALAIGDVAGKGISAALLMATLQSALRTDLRNAAEITKAADSGVSMRPLSTSALVGHLNEQLHAYTSPEKYATFYLGIYDDNSGMLHYTNAGHLPPILVRNGAATRLKVDGTVVGAFAWAKYEESSVQLQNGDLLVCFTDGISEPENEYGEMFGEDRLVDLVIKNAHRGNQEIIDTIIGAVEQWTGSPELQDDMTLLLARRV